jgi:hypothetical protein
MSRTQRGSRKDTQCTTLRKWPGKRDDDRPASRPLVDEELADQLLGKAQAEGVELPGQDGLLSQVTKAVLERALAGGAPTAFADLLASQQRAEFLAGLNKRGVDSGGYPLSTRKWVASFAPGSAGLIGNVIKVHGVMTARTASEQGGTVLAIQVSYIFAYAVEPPGNPGGWMRVLDHQYGSVDFAPWDDPGGPLEPADQTIIGNAGIKGGTGDGYIHPAYPSERTPGATQSAPPSRGLPSTRTRQPHRCPAAEPCAGGHQAPKTELPRLPSDPAGPGPAS